MQIKILILEDSPTDAELILRELKRGKIDCISEITDNEKGFIASLSEFQPDIILSDHAMPGFNSLQALTICKELNYNCPFILVTGAVSEEFAVECIKSGADDYILKHKLIRLPSAIENALKKAKAEQEREIAIRNLEEQNVFMSLLLKSIPIAQYVCKKNDHEITYISNNIYSFSGYHPEQFLQDPKFWYHNVHPEDREHAIRHFENMTSHMELMTEYRWKVSDNTYRWIYDRAKIIKNEDGSSFIAGAMIDISMRKEIEEKLVLKNKELNTFIYRSTHDLRGPLMTILGLTYVAKDEDEPRELRNYIDMIDECTHKLDDVLLSLLTTISIKDPNIISKKINFTNIILSILENCKTIEGFSKINTTTNINVTENMAMDEFAITSILKNIIENAVKYSKNDACHSAISINIHEEDNRIKIQVSDNGIGIPESLQGRVFDMFFRGSYVCKGSGLGLYIVKNAVEKLKGTINLISSPDVGTTIEIFIPV